MPAVLWLFVLGVAAIGGLYALSSVFAPGDRRPLEALPFESGNAPQQHAVSRFHVRWYSVTLLFLAFDMEMVFMYPWALVVLEVGASAVVEMFGFLAVLLVGVVYVWREGALRWT